MALLSDRLRAGVEAPEWVIAEVKRLEDKLSLYRQREREDEVRLQISYGDKMYNLRIDAKTLRTVHFDGVIEHSITSWIYRALSSFHGAVNANAEREMNVHAKLHALAYHHPGLSREIMAVLKP